MPLGHSTFTDAGVGHRAAIVIFNTTTRVGLEALPANDTYLKYQSLDSTTPFTWATNDLITVSYYYRKA